MRFVLVALGLLGALAAGTAAAEPYPQGYREYRAPDRYQQPRYEQSWRERLAAEEFAQPDEEGEPEQAQYYPAPPGYYPPPAPYYGDEGYYRRPRRSIECPPGMVMDRDRYNRPFCKPWRPMRGSECPPGYTLQSGQCKPYRGY